VFDLGLRPAPVQWNTRAEELEERPPARRLPPDEQSPGTIHEIFFDRFSSKGWKVRWKGLSPVPRTSKVTARICRLHDVRHIHCYIELRALPAAQRPVPRVIRGADGMDLDLSN
jgi:hypothetical protein